MLTTLEDLKKLLSDNLNLGDLDLDLINEETPLFSGLGLDSIDAMELMFILHKNYDINVENIEEGKEAFKTVGTLREYIEKKRKK